MDQQLIVACLRFIEYHIEEFLGDKPEEDGKKKKKNDEKKKKLTPAQIDSIFMFSMIWSICSITDDASREMIDIFIREFISDPACVEGASYKNTNTQLLLRGWKYPYKNWEPRKLGLALPSKQTIFDYMYDIQNNKYVLWKDTLVKQKIPATATFSSIVIDTQVTACLGRLLPMLLKGGAPTLVIGPTGTGKSVFIKKVVTQISNLSF